MSTTMIKECPRHGMTEHVLQTNGLWKCKECRKDAVLDIRRRNKIKLVEYKGGKCEICGYDKCVDALEFHHLNPNEKDFGLSCGDTINFEKLKGEVDKCIMVCANCHREIHSKEREKKRVENENKKIENEKKFFESKNKNKRLQSRKFLGSKLDLDNILEEIKNKVPKKEIANKNDVSVKVIKSFLKKNGIEYNESINKNITNKIEIGDFVEQFKKCGAFTKVAEYYGVSDNAIRKWCCKKGIPWRKDEIVNFVENFNAK